MAETQPAPEPQAPHHAQRNWDAIGIVVAALVGLLALIVGGYTAYVQRQQVRAQVWPYLVAGNDDEDGSVGVSSKGVGPAIVRTVRIRVDGKPQRTWNEVLDTLAIPRPRVYSQSTISSMVLKPGEELHMIKFRDRVVWDKFRAAAAGHISIELCYCSTLGECWFYADPVLVGPKAAAFNDQEVNQCPAVPAAELFRE